MTVFLWGPFWSIVKCFQWFLRKSANPINANLIRPYWVLVKAGRTKIFARFHFLINFNKKAELNENYFFSNLISLTLLMLLFEKAAFRTFLEEEEVEDSFKI